ncbi:MAG TPA: N-acetylmuramoyl-L-alanine amidase, partial [bacterium]|nr:N-acetylmuramoyl-L-alanine amidase [bacterium]
LFLAATLFPLWAGAVEIVSVRHWTAPDHTRIVADLSGVPVYRHRSMEDPPRIVLEVEDAVFDFDPEDMAVENEIVSRIRFNKLKKTAQIVIDLEQSLRYDTFFLEAGEGKPPRIVIDVKHPPLSSMPPASRARVEHRLGPDRISDFLIMIDPGHGGEDHGRRNPDGLREKDLALQFAKALQQEINSRNGYRAELTRKSDVFVSLAERRKISEEAGAHLFVSLHLNAAPSKKARGTEVFFVSLEGASDRALKELEQIENSADLAGGIRTEVNASPEVTKMIVDLRQNDSVERSQRLATLITDEVEDVRGIETRRVKQAGFAVLKSLFIPAVLVEIGFLTNADDVRFVRSKAQRDQYVEALADGIVEYCEEVEMPRIGWKMHTVARGETLSEIASHYAMDETTLRAANGIPDGKDGTVSPGKRLRVRAR